MKVRRKNNATYSITKLSQVEFAILTSILDQTNLEWDEIIAADLDMHTESVTKITGKLYRKLAAVDRNV